MDKITEILMKLFKIKLKPQVKYLSGKKFDTE
jgi:hypothetical protein